MEAFIRYLFLWFVGGLFSSLELCLRDISHIIPDFDSLFGGIYNPNVGRVYFFPNSFFHRDLCPFSFLGCGGCRLSLAATKT